MPAAKRWLSLAKILGATVLQGMTAVKTALDRKNGYSSPSTEAVVESHVTCTAETTRVFPATNPLALQNFPTSLAAIYFL